ncbi:hypothetical protein ACWDV4_29685 [Micromonospora sp. NPDC003197]
MATVEEIKAGVAQFGASTEQQVLQILAVAESINQTSALLRAITAGSTHGEVANALNRLEQVKQHLHEAAGLARGAVTATSSYVANF